MLSSLLLLLLHSLLLLPVHAVFVNFENCLPDSTRNSRPQQLQFTPLFVDATFVNERSTHFLNLTIYGNVSGQQFTGNYPPPSDEQWNNSDVSFGKIVNVGTGNRLATLTADYMVLTYTEANNPGERFCDALVRGDCPLGPAFYANASVPSELPAFFLSHDFGTSYSFSTISATAHIISGDEGAPNVACVSAQITPDLGSSIKALLRWLPATILILKAVATVAAAIWSPWGSSDIFRWSSNFGRDEDLLRLVTPGFGDCLQYIQWVVLTGSLTVQYPGFFRPALSQASWSLLLFDESYVSGDSYNALQDGLYSVNATYGLTRMSQLIGMGSDQDIWACMAIWLLVIAGVLVLLCQLGFLARWLYHLATNTTEEDLRQKNLPFTLGMVVRLLFNYFILPIVALSLYQLVISPRSPTSVLVCAVILLVITIVWAGWILRVIFTTKPRTLLFDDMPTLLHYGPLYNTYSDSAAPFALIPVFITFVRGVAIGAVQPSGIAQIIVLAICEVILILTLNGFKPFQGQTSMNLYHTFFASVRLGTLLMMIAFVPTLGVTEAPKGWIGYVILILHACVLVFGFFLNSAQTIIEVIARSLGAGGGASAVRGSILSWRMLKKRQTRPDKGDRGSMMSNAAILRVSTNDAMGSQAYGTRSRSVSASSAQLLNRNRLSGFENFSSVGDTTPSVVPHSELSGGIGQGARPSIATKADGDNFYRPPRARKATITEPSTPGIRSRRNTGGAEFPYQDSPGKARVASYDSDQVSPPPVFLRDRQESVDETGNRTDYAVREVDQYYRGPALNEQATRKLKTGPADPTGPASAAQSWLQKIAFGFSGKKKDQTKGFEVVRSARMPPDMQQQDGPADEVEMQTSPPMTIEFPYRDRIMPDSPLEATAPGAQRPESPVEDDVRFDLKSGYTLDPESTTSRTATGLQGPETPTIDHPVLEPVSAEKAAAEGIATQTSGRLGQETRSSQVTGATSRPSDVEKVYAPRYSDQPIPSLAPIEGVGGIDLPSRWGSAASRSTNAGAPRPDITNAPRIPTPSAYPPPGEDWLRAIDNLSWDHNSSAPTMPRCPTVPRRSSRRTPSADIRAENAARVLRGNDGVFGDGFDGEMGGVPARSNAGMVSKHRAKDSITRNSFGASVAMRGQEGEVVGGAGGDEGVVEMASGAKE
ncbi:unnamed protein product [Zymoseptoria tritici ST99CH_1E4]|uniref:ML-like domain-containing protein n=2 Tax=Zymoseptoria tritici TaxID=1047171 RepID=A0A2H1FIU8_ZYMTR|nr:unnamed protein product [Zymoseptoria tritici ST99CH_1E4]